MKVVCANDWWSVHVCCGINWNDFKKHCCKLETQILTKNESSEIDCILDMPGSLAKIKFSASVHLSVSVTQYLCVCSTFEFSFVL